MRYMLKMLSNQETVQEYSPNQSFYYSKQVAFRQWQHQHQILGGQRGQKVKKNVCEASKNLIFWPFLCWNCQIWSYFNAFGIIGANWRGKKIFCRANAPCPPVVLQLHLDSWNYNLGQDCCNKFTHLTIKYFPTPLWQCWNSNSVSGFLTLVRFL